MNGGGSGLGFGSAGGCFLSRHGVRLVWTGSRIDEESNEVLKDEFLVGCWVEMWVVVGRSGFDRGAGCLRLLYLYGLRRAVILGRIDGASGNDFRDFPEIKII